VYVDGGPDQAYALVERVIGPRLAQTAAHLDHLDHKSRLQEQIALEGRPPPEYVTRAEGPDHAKRFFASVLVGGTVIGEGTGRSKKAAEQSAAAAACVELDDAASADAEADDVDRADVAGA
jgi:ribonuclease-3